MFTNLLRLQLTHKHGINGIFRKPPGWFAFLCMIYAPVFAVNEVFEEDDSQQCQVFEPMALLLACMVPGCQSLHNI